MKQLKITKPSSDGHFHLAYLNYDTGVGYMTAAKDGHTHDLIYDPPREAREPVEAIPPQLDPMTGLPVMVLNPQTGQEMPDPGVPGDPGDPGKEEGTWIVRPAQTVKVVERRVGKERYSEEIVELHEHELVEYRPKKKGKSKKSDKDIIEDGISLWREGMALEGDSRKEGKESEDFWAGKQWKHNEKKKLESLNRPALTINEIAPNIDTLIGHQMEQRTDIRYLPREGGDQRVADMLNVVVKKISDDCFFSREETKVFKDICVPGKGIFNLYVDFQENIRGVPKIERFPWDDVVYGPHEKEDLSDCEFEVRSRMYSLAKLKQMYPKKANDIERSFRSYTGQYPDIEFEETVGGGRHTDYRKAEKVDSGPQTLDGVLPLVDVQKKQFRLAQCTRKMYQDVTVIFNQSEDFFFTAYDWEPEHIAAASTLEGFQVITQSKPRMRITRWCGGVLLSDENPAKLPAHDFFTVPCYGYRQNGEYWGKVQGAKDPQREINKRRSQIMDLMNRLGAEVFYTTPDTFVDRNESEKFKKNRSKPGAIFNVNDLDEIPVRERGADFPSALVNIMQMDQDNLQRLMNVVVNQGGANESGLLFLEKKKGAFTGNQFLFDNLSFSKQKIGRLLLPIIQKYYPPERIENICNSEYSKQKFEIGGEDYASFDRQEIIEMLGDADLMQYDTIVAESSFAASTRLAIAQTLVEMINQGANIPADIPFEFMDVPADIKMRVSERLQQESEAVAAEQTDAANSEIMKTAISQGGYTLSPEQAAEMGLVPSNENGLANQGEIPNNVDDSIPLEALEENLTSPVSGI